MSTSRTRLSPHDSTFLYWERPEQPFHVGECMIYKGKVTAAEMIRMLEERMHLLPRYRQRVVFPPLAAAHPVWQDDPDFDLSRHVVEATLPAPGGDREISTFCGQLFCELIDREHPLWHMTVIDGHVSGDTVIFLKLHHAMVDGVSSVELIEVLHSTKPGAEPPPAPASKWQPRPLPSKVDLLREAAADQYDAALGVVRGMANLLRPGAPQELARRVKLVAKTASEAGRLMLTPPPETPFNKPITAAREFCWLELPLDEVHAVRKVHGATVNDLVLTVLAGGLGRYMRREGAVTEGVELRAMCPVSVRTADQSGTFGNQVSLVAAPLHVGVADPVKRLGLQKESMKKLKQDDQAAGFQQMFDTWKHIPPPVFRLMWETWPKSFAQFNIVSTNVPGPREPLYLGTHELLHWYPFGVNWTTAGLFLCTLSYREHLTLGLVADPTIVGDVWKVNEDLRAAYEELKAASLPTAARSRAVAAGKARVSRTPGKARDKTRAPARPAAGRSTSTSSASTRARKA
jgi:WS/DGAT/MGAT family acyltransferase